MGRFDFVVYQKGGSSGSLPEGGNYVKEVLIEYFQKRA